MSLSTPRSFPMRRPGVVAAVLALVGWLMVPALAQVTKDEVEQALERRADLERQLDDATDAYRNTYAELERTVFRVGELRERIREYDREIARLDGLIEEQAVAAYVSGSTDGLDLFFEADSLTDVLIGRQFLEQATDMELSLLDRLAAVRSGLDSARNQLQQDQARLTQLEKEQEALVIRFDELFDEADVEYRELSEEFAEQERQRELEARRRKLAALIGVSGAAAGAPASVTPGFICPFEAPYSFGNDWGDPRSGGRTHKGTDIVAKMGHPALAVASGVVHLRTSNLGGISIWLDSDYGTAYYYAHLSGYAEVADGGTVRKGQVIGYNGDSGNAQGGVPHLHFEIHPGGRGTAAVNPYPTLVEAC